MLVDFMDPCSLFKVHRSFPDIISFFVVHSSQLYRSRGGTVAECVST